MSLVIILRYLHWLDIRAITTETDAGHAYRECNESRTMLQCLHNALASSLSEVYLLQHTAEQQGCATGLISHWTENWCNGHDWKAEGVGGSASVCASI